METITHANGTLAIVGVVKGLSSERAKVADSFRIKPDFVAISISPEELKGLRKYRDGEMDEEIILSEYEEIYAARLSRWGDVEMPPPCFTEALKIARERKLRVGALDMNEETFTSAYCGLISGTALLRHSLRKSIIKHMEFKADSPEEFVIRWDKKMTAIGGYRKLETEREKFMARRLAEFGCKFRTILAFIDVERARGVATYARDIISKRQSESR